MKRNFVILFLNTLFISTIFSQSGWFQQSPSPTGNTLWSIKFVNTSTGFICGDLGTVLKTTNNGNLWVFKNSGLNSSNILYTIDFFDINIGLILCLNYPSLNYSIFKTTNSGDDWFNIDLPSPHNRSFLRGLNCTYNNTAYIVGDSGKILKSYNGGKNWDLLNTGVTNSLRSVYFINENTGYVVGLLNFSNALVLKTTNGGISWIQQIVSQTSIYVYSIFFIDENTGYIAGGFGNSEIHKTTDGGNNWSVQNFPGGHLNSIYFFNSNIGYTVGTGGTVLNTSNGGNNWNYSSINYANDLTGVYAVSYDTAHFIGSYGSIGITTNGGNNWNSQFSGTTSELHSIFFVNQNTGFAVGYPDDQDNAIVKTTNGGLNWIKKTINSQDYLNDVYFLNSDTGFVIGCEIYKTTDGGNNWNYNNFNQCLYGICFINNNTGFVIGNQLYKTTSGGDNWILISDTGGNSIKFINYNTGYLINGNYYGNYLRKTINGGNNWSTQNLGINEPMESLSFINESTGYLCGGGYYGIIIKTTDGGNNWITIYSGNNSNTNLKSIFFINANTGYSVGGDQTFSRIILKTTNSGISWNLQNSVDSYQLNSVYFIDENTGYVAGLLGTILKTTNGGNPIFVKKISTELPKTTELFQNYPNPFNSQTTIKYQVPFICHLKIIIYDALGKEAEVLVNQNQQPGKYEVTWDASNFASGVYFYKLTAGYFVNVKKMVLIK